MTKVSERLGLTLVNYFGQVDHIALDPDVVLLPHSLLAPSALAALRDRPYRAIRMIRDPRDVWVSGYLYHRHCKEKWCTNTDLDPTPPIGWPQVDHSFAHRSEDWKRRYLERLNGRSYQQNLLDCDMAEGLTFERQGYTSCTLDAMREWKSYGLVAMDLRLEDVMADFDGGMLRIFEHFGFTAEHSLAALDVARSEDIHRMDEAALALRPQVHSRVVSKWRLVLSAAQVAEFEACNGELVEELGYELAARVLDTAGPSDDWVTRADERRAADVPLAADVPSVADIRFNVEIDEARLIWPQLTQSPASAGAAAGAAVWLLADGVMVRPMLSDQGIWRFVVPPGVQRLRLESRRVVLADRRAPYLGGTRPLGVKVSAIVIRSHTHEVVIPADDPRLIAGWYEVEQSGRRLTRWTDGSAELPWAVLPGPAVVTLRCQLPAVSFTA